MLLQSKFDWRIMWVDWMRFLIHEFALVFIECFDVVVLEVSKAGKAYLQLSDELIVCKRCKYQVVWYVLAYVVQASAYFNFIICGNVELMINKKVQRVNELGTLWRSATNSWQHNDIIKQISNINAEVSGLELNDTRTKNGKEIYTGAATGFLIFISNKF